MKRFAPVLLASGFALTLAGCTPATVSDTTTPSSNTSEAAASEYTLVSLKVPNMV